VSIEAAINTRALLKKTIDTTALTPAVYLHGRKRTTIPTGPETSPSKDVKREYRLQQQAAEDIWKRWTKEYLLELRCYHHIRRTKGKLKKFRVGDFALFQEEVRPRLMWKRVLIKELRSGIDGRIRTVILRTLDGNRISRPVKLVIPLEIDQGGENVEG